MKIEVDNSRKDEGGFLTIIPDDGSVDPNRVIDTLAMAVVMFSEHAGMTRQERNEKFSDLMNQVEGSFEKVVGFDVPEA
jgi:hypothetical protein